MQCALSAAAALRAAAACAAAPRAAAVSAADAAVGLHPAARRRLAMETAAGANPGAAAAWDEDPGLGRPLPHATACAYLDYNATSPIYPPVAAAMAPFLYQRFGNPSSGHVYGAATAAAMARARSGVAALICAAPEEIVFTGCGTESDNWAIAGAAAAHRARAGPAAPPPHVVSCAIEHPAVVACLAAQAAQGLLTYSLVAVDAEGRVAAADVLAAVDAAAPGTVALVTVMHSNNEVGALQPVADIAAGLAARAADAGGRRPLLHTDAAQSAGKVPLSVGALGVDLLTLARAAPLSLGLLPRALAAGRAPLPARPPTPAS